MIGDVQEIEANQWLYNYSRQLHELSGKVASLIRFVYGPDKHEDICEACKLIDKAVKKLDAASRTLS